MRGSRPSATTTSLAATFRDITAPCANETDITGTDATGNLFLAKRQLIGSGTEYRVCAFRPNAELFPLPYSWSSEARSDSRGVLVVETDRGTTVVLNDLIFDLANRPGLSGWLFKLIGMTGDEPHIPAPVKLKEVEDKALISEQLERWAHMPSLQRVIISHGNIIKDAPSAVLTRISAELRA